MKLEEHKKTIEGLQKELEEEREKVKKLTKELADEKKLSNLVQGDFVKGIHLFKYFIY